MRHIKKFNESSEVPLFKRGEVLVFAKKETDQETIKSISKKLGVSLDRKHSIDDDIFVIKTPIGKENETGQDFIDNYPEFFYGFEREDINLENIYNEIEDIKDSLGNLDQYFGHRSGRVDPKINIEIDNIIEKLQKLKI